MDSDVHEGKNGWLFLTGAIVTLYGATPLRFRTPNCGSG